MHLRPLRAGALILVLLSACALLLTSGAGTAKASPPAPWLTVDALQTALDASPGGTLDGYFKTVLSGAEIEQIPVTVSSLVPDSYGGQTLILFQASGSRIDAIGGIAHGMSGSPLYVTVGGVDMLAGAVSYGDIFTKGGLGLATPVEYMASMEDVFLGPASTVTRLAAPVKVDGATISRVAVEPSAAAARRRVPPAAGTAVMAPLATIGISGLPRGSTAYQDLAKRFGARGYDVAPYGSYVAGWDPDFETPLVGGASVGMMYTRGSVEVGALGTVTYADGDHVLCFGHPLDGIGDVQYYLTNAWVEGVWSSDYDPYKLMDAGKVRGVMTQDREPGVAGTVGATVPETAFDASVSYEPYGRTAEDTFFMPRWLVGEMDPYLGGDLMSSAGYRATMSEGVRGSARTTTTVKVSNGVDPAVTITRSNVWDDTSDVVYAMTSDVSTILEALTSDEDGLVRAQVESVDMTGTVSPQRISARIAGVQVKGGLKVGSNTIDVTLYGYGQETPIHATGTLVLPAGTSTQGTLAVSSATGDLYGGSAAASAGGAQGRAVATDGRQTLADIVAELRSMPTNDQIVVDYYPLPGDGSTAIGTVIDTDRYVTGYLELVTGRIDLTPSAATVAYKGSVTVNGVIEQAAGDTTVDLYTKGAGDTAETKVATLPAKADGGGGATFSGEVKGLTTNTKLTVRWDGDDSVLGARASTTVKVRQAVTLTVKPTAVTRGGTVKLTAAVLPGRPGQSVWFERKVNGQWVLIKAAKLTGSLTATYTWTPPRGSSYVRARVAATSANASAASPMQKVRVQ